YTSINVIYNLYFHPLRQFPGPFLARSSLVWRIFHSTGGRFHRAIDEQHIRYGPVFRVSPNELSFASVNSWKAIYGHQPAGKPVPPKAEFYDIYGSAYKTGCIGSERNPQRHSRMKKNLTAAFSTRALTEQEGIISGCVDRFVEKIGTTKGARSEGLNMVKWFEMIAFDILGQMAFGESFHAVDSGKPHFWSELIVKHLFFITVMDNMRRYPFLVALGKRIWPWATVAVMKKHSEYTRAQVARRMNKKTTRKDFLSSIVDKVESGDIDTEELNAHASTLVIAGGETVATFLAAVTYYLLKNPHAYQKLQDEVRSAFNSYDDINATSAQRLPYLQAVISEGLRIYPPGSQGFPRVSPGLEVDGFWVPKGAEMYTSAWTVTHDAKYFHDPMSFKPERWIDPECTDAKEASQPFSLGTRGCLGRNFAYAEINLILAKMHWRFDLEMVNEELDWEGQSYLYVMWSKPSMYVRLLPRASRS
ncbi:putative cytochrome P450, partial [Lophium mytilinum]